MVLSPLFSVETFDGGILGSTATFNKTWIGKILAKKFTKTLHGITQQPALEC